MKTTIHCDERITNIRHTIYVKLFWGIIIANELTYLLDYFFKTSLNGWVIPLAPDVLIIWMSIKGVLFNGTQHLSLIHIYISGKRFMNPFTLRRHYVLVAHEQDRFLRAFSFPVK